MDYDSDDSSASASASAQSDVSVYGDGDNDPSGQDANSPSALSSDDSSSQEFPTSMSNTFKQPTWMTNAQNSSGIVNSRTDSIRDIIREASIQPELYGVRRSGRPRTSVVPSATYGSCDGDSSPSATISGNINCASESDESAGGPSPSDSGSDYGNHRKKKTRPKPKRKTTATTGKRRRPNAKAEKRKVVHQPVTFASSNMSSDDNDSDADFPSNSSSDGSEAEYYRASKWQNKRVTQQAVSYKEQSSDESTDLEDVVDASEQADDAQSQEEDNAETIEKVLRHRIGRKGAIGSQTVSYVAENEGDPNDGFDPSTDEPEVHYFIKWKGWAHIHNTWDSEASLREQKVNGLKRLDNYIKKEECLSNWKKRANIDELEYFACQQEMTEQLQNQYCQVERVIRCKTQRNEIGELVTDYLVKWQGLPYSCCTEEDGNLIDRLFPKAVDEYHCRLKSTCTPTLAKLCRALKTRPKFVPLKDQPSHLGGEDCLKLRDYQLEGVNWLVHSWCKENSVILADEMGLGKTIQTISFLSVLMNNYAVYGPFLLLVPLSTLATWIKEFRLWAPHINVVEYIGDVNSRAKIRDEEWCHPGNKKIKFNVLITTYEILLKDKDFLDKLSWAVLGVDEAHRLKNDDSTLYKYLITFKTNHRLLITGTPLQNSLKELWALLHFLMPEKYVRWEDFEAKHVSADKTGFQNLHSELQPFLLRRVKKDVEKSLPAKVEQILRVEMSNVQKKYYKLILTKNYRELSKGSKSSTTSFLNIAMELKKCCNHAFLVRSPEDIELQRKSRFELLVKSSGKLILLDKLLMRLKEAGHRVLIFSQMVRMLDILAEYLQLRRFTFQRLDGSIRGELRKQAMDHFNAEYSQDFCFLLSTRAGGLGVNLATADTVIIFDSDWNPQNDLQAQARAHRIGQKNQVSVYRLVTKNSMEEDILERAKKKMVLDHLVIQRMDTTGRTAINPGSLSGQSTNNTFNREELNAILKFGAEELFKETDDDEDIQVDIDDILRVAEQRTVEDSKNSATDELLSQFKVVSFENLEDEELEGHASKGPSWDDIIPEAERRRIEDEELHKQLVALHPPPRSRKSVNSSNPNGRQSSGQAKKPVRDSSEDDVDRDDDDETSSDKPRKRGRPRTVQDIKGFTNTEVRRFLKSIKKFGRPVERLDDIACDAELQEKSKSDLVRLANLILERCKETMEAYEVHCEDESNTTRQPPTFKLSKVTVNAKLTLQAINELEPLFIWMNDSTLNHARLPSGMHVKDAHFDCPWTDAEDASMLKGVFKYGTGNWEAIRIDPELNLSQILPDRNLKPQAKHLQTRFEYLLRALQNHAAKSAKLCKQVSKPKVPRSRAKIKEPPADTIVPPVVSNGHPIAPSHINTATDGDDTSCDIKSDVPTDAKKTKAKNDKKKRSANIPLKKVVDNIEKVKSQPLHITTNETKTVADSVVELLPEVFAQCKEKMRPVKKALKQLGSPDPNSPQEAHLEHTRRCLLKIGDHINDLLNAFTDPTELKDWRNNLWLFVSKFTDLTPNRLHKVYRHMAKKRDEEDGLTESCQTAAMDEVESHHDGNQKHASSNSNFAFNDHVKESVNSGRNIDTSAGHGIPSRLANSEREWRHNSPLARDELSRHRNDDSTGGYGRPHGYSQGNDRNHHRYSDNKPSERRGGGSGQSSRTDKTNSDSRYHHDSSSRQSHHGLVSSSSNCNTSRSDETLSRSFNCKRSFNTSQNSIDKSYNSSRLPELKKSRISTYDDSSQVGTPPMSRNR